VGGQQCQQRLQVCQLQRGDLASTGGFYGIGGYTGIEEPYGIAIDTAGDAWITNPNVSYVTELNSAGTAVTNSPFGTGTQSRPTYIAIDGLSNAWITDDSVYGSASSSSRAQAHSSHRDSATAEAAWMALRYRDRWLGQRVAWQQYQRNRFGVLQRGRGLYEFAIHERRSSIPSRHCRRQLGPGLVPNYNDTVTVLSNTGAPVSGTSGYSGGGVDDPYYVAMDGAGNAWIANASGFGSTVSELTNAGTPITTSLGYGYASLSSANSGNTGIAVDGSGMSGSQTTAPTTSWS